MNQKKAGAILSYIHMVVNTVINLLYVPLLLYYIGQSEYGLYKLLASFIAYFGVMDVGLNAAVIRFYTHYLTLRNNDKIDILLGMSSRFYLGISLLLVLFAGIVFFNLDKIFGESLTPKELQEAYQIFALLVFNVVFSLGSQIYKAVIIAHERFVLLKGSALLRILFQPLVIIVALQYYQNALVVVAIQSLFNLFNTLIYVWYAYNKLSIRISYHGMDRSMIMEMKNLAISILVVFIVDQIFWETNQILLGMYVGTATVAVYAVASQIYVNYCQFSTIIPEVLGPKMTTMVSLGATEKDLSEEFIKIGRIQYFFSLGIVIGFFLFGKEFIILWAGETFADAYWIALFIIIPRTIEVVQNLGLVILQAQNRYGIRAKVYSLSGIANILLVLIIIKTYGGIGCALVTGGIIFVSNGLFMNLYYARNIHLQIKRFWIELGKISFVAMPVLFIGWILNSFLDDSTLLVLIFKLLIFLLTYCYLVYCFAMNRYERDLFSLAGIMRKLHVMG